MGAILRFGNNWLAWGGKLLSMPDSLYAYIVNAFSNGWDRNRAIDTTGGANNNALMGGYLLAASNTTIAISGICTTDTIVALTPNGLVGTVAVTGTMTFITGQSYGAFEVYRSGTKIGRYCIIERIGTILINQYTGSGALPNGLLGGTTTTVWQRSNAFYCETNQRGYSIAGTGWVTNAGESIPVNALVPADLSNPTKCLAWVGGVQQDLQFVGRAKNSISVMPYAAWCNSDRVWSGFSVYSGTLTSHKINVYMILQSAATTAYIYHEMNSARGIIMEGAAFKLMYKNCPSIIVNTESWMYNAPILVESIYDGAAGTVFLSVTNLQTGQVKTNSASGCPASITLTASYVRIATSIVGYYQHCIEWRNGVKAISLVPNNYTADMYELVGKTTVAVVGVSTNIHQNVDMCYNVYNATGYELWTNGTDYLIYPLANNGTRYITPAGYTLVETVTAGSMPSVADSRFTTFKYALANSCVLRNSVPEAYNADSQATPKILTYAELSALSSNIKVTKTEVNGKITNITIRQ